MNVHPQEISEAINKSEPSLARRINTPAASRVHQFILFFSLLLVSTASGCVYHRKGHHRHPFLYDDNHRDAVVIFPGEFKDSELEHRFDQHFEFSLLATVGSWFGQFPELGDCMIHFDSRMHHILSLGFMVPPVLHAITTSEADIESAVIRAESLAEKKENH